MSRDKYIMINSGEYGKKGIRECQDERDFFCDQVHLPFYYDKLTGTCHEWQGLWYMVADICAFDEEMNPINHTEQHFWRACSVPVYHEHCSSPTKSKRCCAMALPRHSQNAMLQQCPSLALLGEKGKWNCLQQLCETLLLHNFQESYCTQCPLSNNSTWKNWKLQILD